jgi:hypothetical protein
MDKYQKSIQLRNEMRELNDKCFSKDKNGYVIVNKTVVDLYLKKCKEYQNLLNEI